MEEADHLFHLQAAVEPEAEVAVEPEAEVAVEPEVAVEAEAKVVQVEPRL